MTRPEKVAIIGAGHNGLVCACYLAKAGFEVTIFESRNKVGGLCVTEEVFPGVKTSTGAGYYGMFRPEIINELNLTSHGLEAFLTNPVEIVLLPQNQFLFTPRYEGTSRIEIDGLSDQDLTGWAKFWQDVSASAEVLSDLHFKPDSTQEQICSLLIENGQALVAEHIFEKSLLDLASHYFKNETLLAAVCTTTVGFPNKKGSLFACLYLGTAMTQGQRGAWGILKGGMGAITQALQKVAEEHKIQIQTNQKVDSLIFEKDIVCGVVLADQSRHYFDIVISNADPDATFNQLLNNQGYQSDFDISAGKAHFLLKKLPKFTVLDKAKLKHNHACAFVLAPSLKSVIASSKIVPDGFMPDQLMITLDFPTVTDPTLAPKNTHLLSLDYHFLPAFFNQVEWDESNKNDLYKMTVEAIAAHAPGFESLVKEWAISTPFDLKKNFGLSSKHCWHMPMSSNHLMEKRRFGKTAYSTKFPNFYLCGASTYPGGNVTGAPGFNCAQEIIQNFKGNR